MASTDSMPVPKKGVAFRVDVYMEDAVGDPVTGFTSPDSEVSKDGFQTNGTTPGFSDCTNEVTYVGHGFGYLDLTATEMNADMVRVHVTCTEGHFGVTIVPEEVGDIRANAAQIGGTSQTGRDIGASVLLSSGTGTGQISLSSGKVTADVDTIKTNPVVNAGTVTFPTGATLASTTNITAGTITTATNVTNLAANSITAAATATDFSNELASTIFGNGNWTGLTGEVTAVKAKTDNLPLAPAATGDAMTLTSGERTTLAAAFWNALTSGLTTISSIGKLLVDNINATIGSRAAPGDAMTLADGSITAAKIAADAITAAKIDATAITEIQSGLSTLTESQLLAKVNEALAAAGEEIEAADLTDAPGIKTILQLLYQWRRNGPEDTQTLSKIKDGEGEVVVQAAVTSSNSGVSVGQLGAP